MLCKKPYLRAPVGLTPQEVFLSEESRQAGVPYPCGKCIHCRINRSRVWQHRIMLENMAHDYSSFVTLTYNDDHLPGYWWARNGESKYCHVPGTLVKKHYQDFLKRLRYYFGKKKIKYYLVGEYGETDERPHYHVMLFGVGIHQKSIVEKAWSKGFVYSGDISKDSARYVTKYVTKGWFGKSEWAKKKLGYRIPEFSVMSKQEGGLGYETIKKYAKDINSSFQDFGIVDQLSHGGKNYPLGKYLTKKLAKLTDNENLLYERYDDYVFKIFAETFDQKRGKINTGFMQEKTAGKRLQAERRHEIFKQKSKL